MAALDTSDTIAAISSPTGPALRGIVRVSGPEAWAVALSMFEPAAVKNELVRTTRPRRVEGSIRIDGVRPALPGSVFLWSAPRTYTGQDLAEIHTIGATPIVALVLSHCLARGARLAEPGEFTLRAFLSGRIDLTQAEAVLDVIDAPGPSQLQTALAQLAGGLAGPIRITRDRLLDLLAHLEAGLDFVDEADVDPIARAATAAALARESAELAALADRLSTRDRPDALPRVVLVGPPNAGKSSLLNALVGRDAALTSPVAGTTRDYLTATCDCDGITVELVDTAGLDDPRNAIEAAAQRLRGEQADRADLVLRCRPMEHVGAIEAPRDPTAIDVLTKSDLGSDTAGASSPIRTSSATGSGLIDLKRAIAGHLRARAAETSAVLPAGTSARCRAGLARAAECLARASETLALGLGDELVATDLREALDDLGKVVGATVTDDILDRIFQRFCIGK